MAGCDLELTNGSEEATPSLKLLLPEKQLGLTAMEAVVLLQSGNKDEQRPAVAPKPPNVAEGAIEFGPICLRPGDSVAVAAAVRAIVESAAVAAGVTATAVSAIEH